MPSLFQTATTWDTISPMHFRGLVSLDWSQGRAAAGSYLLAIVVRHLQVCIDRPLRTLTVQFISPLKPGEASLEIQILRDGRNLTHVQATFLQEGKSIAIVFAACGSKRSSEFALKGDSVPRLPAPEKSIEMPEMDFIPRFTRWYDYRWASAPPFSGADNARIAGWIRPVDGPLDLPALASVTDAWPAPIWILAKRPFPSSSVNFHLMIHSPMALYDEGLFYAFASKSSTAGGGYVDSQASVWGPDGQLLATARQCIAEFSGRN